MADKTVTSRQHSIAAILAAKRRAIRRRRIATWAAAGVSVVAVVSAVALLVSHQVSAHGAAHPSAGAARGGPEGMPLQTGRPLATLAHAASGRRVDGIGCDASEHVDYHIHVHLAVYVNGTLRPVPYGIGVVTPAVSQTARGPFVQATRCYYWLHTHATDGIIHVESPTARAYTLGSFFDIWGQPLGSNRAGPATGAVIAYVDGARYHGDPRQIVLRSHEDIQLDIGAPAVPPQRVDWSSARL